MNPPGDDVGGMGMTELPDEAIEAFFLGDAHDAWEQDEALADLADQVLFVATGPAPRRSPALRAFLGQQTRASAPSPVASTPLPATPAWRPRTAVAPPATADRRHNVVPLFRRLRLTAAIAAAAAVAAAALAVGGTHRVLPEPAMRAVSWVVEAVTPFKLPEPARTVSSTDHAPRPGQSTTVPPDRASGPRAPGQGVVPGQGAVPGPGATEPATPPTSVPAGPPGSVQAPGLGIAPGRQSPTGPSVPLGHPLPPAGISPPAGGGGGLPSTTSVARGPQNPGGGSVPPSAGTAPGRR